MLFDKYNISRDFTYYRKFDQIHIISDKKENLLIESWIYYKEEILDYNSLNNDKASIILNNFLKTNKRYSFYILLNNCKLPHYQRHRIKRNGQIYNPHSSILKEYKDKIFKPLYKDCPILCGSTKIDVELGIPIPSSGMNIGMKYILENSNIFQPASAPDFDNYMKFIADAIQGDVIINDDAQIYSGNLSKSFSKYPYVELLITGDTISWKNM